MSRTWKLTARRVERLEQVGVTSIRQLHNVLHALDLTAKVEVEFPWDGVPANPLLPSPEAVAPSEASICPSESAGSLLDPLQDAAVSGEEIEHES